MSTWQRRLPGSALARDASTTVLGEKLLPLLGIAHVLPIAGALIFRIFRAMEREMRQLVSLKIA